MKPLELTVLMYHYVRDPGDNAECGSGIPGMPLAKFEAQLDRVLKHYHPITWPDLRQYLQNDSPLPPAACLITFDDGVRDHYVNAFPALHRRGLSGLFFCLARQPGEGFILAHKIHFLLPRLGLAGLKAAVWARLSEQQQAVYTRAEAGYQRRYDELDTFKAIMQRDLSGEINGLLSDLLEAHVGHEPELSANYYLNPEQINWMKAGGMHFGGHSHTHPWFDWIEPAELAGQIEASAGWLQSVEAAPWAFAYPYGGLNPAAGPLLERQGFAAAFTTRSHIQQTDPLLIGRIDAEELSGDLMPLAPEG